MRCPNDDADLLNQTKQHDGLTITYAVCPACHGSWLDAFNANYLKTEDIMRSPRLHSMKTAIEHPFCPICQVGLKIYRGQNIPEAVRAWNCPNGHGYFFPEAQLFAFKKAQEAKINYLKLWNIPLASVSSVLLASITFIAAVGVLTTYFEMQQRQTTVLQAQNVIRQNQAFVSGTSVILSVTTTVPADVVVHLDTVERPMESKDRTLHSLLLTNLTSGTYTYYYTFSVQGKPARSDPYFFIIP